MGFYEKLSFVRATVACSFLSHTASHTTKELALRTCLKEVSAQFVLSSYTPLGTETDPKRNVRRGGNKHSAHLESPLIHEFCTVVSCLTAAVGSRDHPRQRRVVRSKSDRTVTSAT